MRLPVGDMKVMIPSITVKGSFFGEVIDSEGVKKVFCILRQQSSAMFPTEPQVSCNLENQKR